MTNMFAMQQDTQRVKGLTSIWHRCCYAFGIVDGIF